MALALVCVILAVLCLILFVQNYLMKKTAKEITAGVVRNLHGKTGTLITVSSSNPQLNTLAITLNRELQAFHSLKRKYMQGDQNLKNSVMALSHDLRTPLTAIQGYLDLLQLEDKSEEAGRYIEIIDERVKVLQNLMEELFQYSIAQSTSQTLSLQKTDLRGVLEKSLLSMAASLHLEDLDPEIVLPDHPVFRMADPAALARIYANLLTNALRYARGPLKISLDEQGTVIFQNPAPGLSAVEVEQLFDRFYTVSTGGRSSGLGLSITRTLCEKMNGSVRAELIDGQLIFTLSFLDAPLPDKLIDSHL